VRDHCALARANRVFRMDEKRIHTESTVMNKSNNGRAVQVAAYGGSLAIPQKIP
jgi:hypothetical protein